MLIAVSCTAGRKENRIRNLTFLSPFVRTVMKNINDYFSGQTWPLSDALAAVNRPSSADSAHLDAPPGTILVVVCRAIIPGAVARPSGMEAGDLSFSDTLAETIAF